MRKISKNNLIKKSFGRVRIFKGKIDPKLISISRLINRLFKLKGVVSSRLRVLFTS